MMMESQKLARLGLETMAAHGWPEDAAKALMDVFMQAGFALCLEKQEEALAAKDALIQKVMVQ